jgi:hypothetical protein
MFPSEAFFIAKTSATGDIQWNITPSEIHTPPNFTLADAYQTSDGGYILAGEGNNQSGYDLWTYPCLIKLSDNGVPEWNRTYYTYYGTFNDLYPTCVEQTADGGYILGGFSGLLKTDSTGNPQWNITYQGGLCTFVHQTADGGYVVGGQDDEGRLFLLGTNSTGNVVWNQTYGEASLGFYLDVSDIATSDGGYAIATVTGGNLVLDKIAGNGTLLWQKTYAENWVWNGFLVVYCDIQQTSDGGYIIAGTAWEPSNSSVGPLLLKVDGSGAVQWMKRDFGGSFMGATACSVVQSSDGGYTLAGVIGADSFIVGLAANPTYAPSATSVVMAVLESVAFLLLEVAAIRNKPNITAFISSRRRRHIGTETKTEVLSRFSDEDLLKLARTIPGTQVDPNMDRDELIRLVKQSLSLQEITSKLKSR